MTSTGEFDVEKLKMKRVQELKEKKDMEMKEKKDMEKEKKQLQKIKQKKDMAKDKKQLQQVILLLLADSYICANLFCCSHMHFVLQIVCALCTHLLFVAGICWWYSTISSIWLWHSAISSVRGRVIHSDCKQREFCFFVSVFCGVSTNVNIDS